MSLPTSGYLSLGTSGMNGKSVLSERHLLVVYSTSGMSISIRRFKHMLYNLMNSQSTWECASRVFKSYYAPLACFQTNTSADLHHLYHFRHLWSMKQVRLKLGITLLPLPSFLDCGKYALLVMISNVSHLIYYHHD